MSGAVCAPIKLPTEFGQETWKKHPLVKIVSGSHHSVALTSDKKVFAWGDAESGKIGRMLKSRARNEQAMKIEAVGAKDPVDVFCNNNSSFYVNSKGSVYAWGLNNHG